jgi:spermidine/putrescine transport system permease protein
MNGMLKQAFSSFGKTGTAIIFLLVGGWMIFMIISPQIIALDYSFRPLLSLRDIGGPKDTYTLKNYITLMTNTLHRAVFFKTIWSSLLVTFLALCLCYPISYYMAKAARRSHVSLLMMCIIVPYWINELLRIFAWQLILSDAGILNQILLWLQIINEPVNFRAGDTAVILGMVYAYILFMVFPLYNAMESLDTNQIDGARDLGASWLRIHRKIVIPHAKPGMAVGCIMTFMLAAGSVAAPQLLGSPSSFWFTQIIYTNYETANWNLGTAYAEVLALLCLIFMFLMLKVFKVGLKEFVR